MKIEVKSVEVLLPLIEKIANRLLHDKINAGINLFSFNTEALSKGIYFLKISDNDQTLVNKKLVVQ